MVGTKLTGLMLSLLMCFLSLRESSSAQTHQVTDEIAKAEPGYVFKGVELHDEASTIAARKLLRGRSVTDNVAVKVKEERRRRSDANLSLGGCGHHTKGKSNVECELRDAAPSAPNLVGYMPFTADYHTPRTHPPKNN